MAQAFAEGTVHNPDPVLGAETARRALPQPGCGGVNRVLRDPLRRELTWRYAGKYQGAAALAPD